VRSKERYISTVIDILQMQLTNILNKYLLIYQNFNWLNCSRKNIYMNFKEVDVYH